MAGWDEVSGVFPEPFKREAVDRAGPWFWLGIGC